MKTKTLRRKSIAKTRWAAYAAASAATALAGSNSAEAAIHYSGRLNVPFPPDESKFKDFELEGAFFNLKHDLVGFAGFNIFSSKSFGYAAGFRGYSVGRSNYFVSKLSFGQNISGGLFERIDLSYFGRMAGSGAGQWTRHGVGYVGFRFKTDAGIQYGWARIVMAGRKRNNAFKLLDYAYADPGEAITAGQISSDEQAVEQNSLGWLAVGAVGLLAWRKSRSRAAN